MKDDVRVRLTKTVIDAADPRSERYTLFDRDIRGFGLRVYPSGQKSFIFEYKSAEGGRTATTKRVTLGKVGQITPQEARTAADKLRAETRLGSDPQALKRREREAVKFSDLVDTFLKQHVEPKRSAGTKAHYEDVLRRLVIPAIGTKRAKDITRHQIAKLHLDWARTPFQANRILSIVSSLYSYAGKHGLTPEGYNPAKGVERFSEEGRERVLSSAELERLGASIRQAETSGIEWEIDPSKNTKHVPKAKQSTVIGEHAAAAIRLIIFTGARVDEILSLKWSYVDMERGVLQLPDSKTGKKTIFLNAPSLAVLNGLKRVGAYVIAGESAGTAEEKPRSDLKRPWNAVRRHAGLDTLRLHDLRHNFASFGAAGSMGLPMIGKLLGHTQPQTTQRYAHLDADPMLRASNAIGQRIADAMGETPATNNENVIPMRPSKSG